MVPRIKGIILLNFFSLFNFIMEVLYVVFEKYTKIFHMLRPSSMSNVNLFVTVTWFSVQTAVFVILMCLFSLRIYNILCVSFLSFSNKYDLHFRSVYTSASSV